MPAHGRGVQGPIGGEEKEAQKRAIFQDLQARGFTLCYRWRATASHPLFLSAAARNGADVEASAKAAPPHKALEERLLRAFDYPANKKNNLAYRFDFKITHEDWLLRGQFPILL